MVRICTGWGFLVSFGMVLKLVELQLEKQPSNQRHVATTRRGDVACPLSDMLSLEILVIWVKRP